MGSEAKRIIITGASSGIGRAISLEYALRGARLVLAARRADALDVVVREARARGAVAHAVALDVTDPKAPSRLLAAADEAFGGVDTVIMNAGIGYPAFAASLRAEQTGQVTRVNYLSAVAMISAVLPRMLAAKRGQIVAISSLAAFRGMPGSGAYSASKAALTVLMESLRTELRSSGVVVTTIFPGFVRTPMTDRNEFRMPFLLEPDVAARRIVAAIEKGRTDYRFPRRLSLLVRLSALAPNWLHDRVVSRGRRMLAR
jgi:short-subunit dehydrogenase